MDTPCAHTRRLSFSAKCSDMCSVKFPDGTKMEGYVPYGIGIGGGDYLSAVICVDCKVVIDFPAAEDVLTAPGDED